VLAARVVGLRATTGQIFSEMVALTWQPRASVVRTMKLVAAPVEAVGVPEMTPAVLRERPAGSVPLVTVHEPYGAVPPLPVRV
jgi:hypothetical protein